MNKATMMVLVPILCAQVWIPIVNGQRYSEAKALLAQLFTTADYNKKIRPEENLTDITRKLVDFIPSLYHQSNVLLLPDKRRFG